jgi:predicted lipid-binding transport protein (Tim44 family)
MRYRCGERIEVLRQLWSGTRVTTRGGLGAILAMSTIGFSEIVLGRAGGGAHSASHASSSNHGTSSTGGSSGGSFGGLIALLVIALLIGYVVRRIKRNGAQNLGAPTAEAALAALGSVLSASGIPGAVAASGGSARPLRPIVPAAIDTMRAEDPGFEMESFLQRAEMTFFLVKRGIQRNAAVEFRPFVSDTVFADLSRSVGTMRDTHRHLLLEGLNVRGVHLKSAECDAQTQKLQIHFDLVYRSKVLDDAEHSVSDDGEEQHHAEIWTFERAAQARTSTSGDVTASRCPACGAELRLSLNGSCEHCKASVTNGTVDWVVGKIENAAFADTPDLAFVAQNPGEGIENLRAGDPAFSLEAFLSRARTAFLALQDAWCKQNLDAGRAFLSPGAYFAWSAQLETLKAEGRRDVMENVQIRGMNAARVVHGRVFDDLTIRIDAAAADYEVDASGKMVYGDRSIQPFSELWTFQRSVGVASTARAGTLESACPGCGAPVALNQIGECRYCKAAVTSGKFDWVVSRIEQQDGNDGADLAEQVSGAIMQGLINSVRGPVPPPR